MFFNLFLVLSENADETFVCPEVGGNGNYADPATCRRFYQVIFLTSGCTKCIFIILSYF